MDMGGVDYVSEGRTLQWPAGRRGICGDKKDDGPWNYEVGGAGWKPNQFARTYLKGQEFTAKFFLASVHRGRMGLRICKIPNWTQANEKTQLTDACLDAHVLKQGPSSTQAPGDPWYHLGYKLKARTMLTTTYKLPSDLVCGPADHSRCVMQFYYLTVSLVFKLLSFWRSYFFCSS